MKCSVCEKEVEVTPELLEFLRGTDLICEDCEFPEESCENCNRIGCDNCCNCCYCCRRKNGTHYSDE